MSAYLNKNRKTDVLLKKEIESVMLLVYQSIGDDVKFMSAKELSGNQDYKNTCQAHIKYYNVILSMDKNISADIIKFVLKNQAAQTE